MQAVRKNVQVVPQSNFRHPDWHSTATTQQRELVMVIIAPPSGAYKRVTILITNIQRKAYNFKSDHYSESSNAFKTKETYKTDI